MCVKATFTNIDTHSLFFKAKASKEPIKGLTSAGSNPGKMREHKELTVSFCGASHDILVRVFERPTQLLLRLDS